MIRPGGNAVVFNFPWDSSANMFAAVGVPQDVGGRDDKLLYTLVDLTPQNDTDLSYQLRFADGTTHTFDAGSGALSSVGDVNSGLSASTAGLPALSKDPQTGDPKQIQAQITTPGNFFSGMQPTTTVLGRYNIAFKFSGGNIRC